MSETGMESLVRRSIDLVNGKEDSGPGMDEIFTEDFYDHVSGQRGKAIWARVAAWGRTTFAYPQIEVHEVMTRDDKMLVWFTLTATYIGNGFPRLRDIPVTGQRVTWPQVHIFRVADGLLAEHWAVRDDYATVEAAVGRGPLVGPPEVDVMIGSNRVGDEVVPAAQPRHPNSPDWRPV